MKKGLTIFGIFVGLLACLLLVLIPLSDNLPSNTLDNGNAEITDDVVTPTAPDSKPEGETEHSETVFAMGELMPLINDDFNANQDINNRKAIIGRTLSLENGIDVIYYLDADAIKSYWNSYIVFEIPVYDENGSLLDVEIHTIYYNSVTTINGKEVLKFKFTGLTAMKMSVVFTVTVYDNNEFVESETFSITEYAYRQLNNPNSSQTLKTLLVDMLNYGALSQLYFEYNTENLANANLTDEQQAYATSEVPESTSIKEVIEGEDSYVKYIAASLSLENTIALNLYFEFNTLPPEDIGILIEYQEIHEDGRIFIDGAELEYCENINLYKATLYMDYASEIDKSYSFSFYDLQNQVQIGDIVTHSIESYIAIALQKSNVDDLNSLLESMLKYSASAEKYMGENNIVHKVVQYEGKSATCTEIGWYNYEACTGCNYSTYCTIPATGHNFCYDYYDYMYMFSCTNTGCQQASRLEGDHTYDNMFSYDFTETDKANMEANIQEFYDMLDYVGAYDPAHHAYDPNSYLATSFTNLMDCFWIFNNDVSYIMTQYQNAYVLYYITINDESAKNYAEINALYNEKLVEFYLCFRLIYDSAYREYFVDYFGEATAEYYVSLSDSYGGGNATEISKRIGEIEAEFMALADEKVGNEVPVLYEEFVNLNNQLATMQGYDNYLEYAYANEYNRSYTTEESKLMRSYVKTYIKDLYRTLLDDLKDFESNELSADASEIFNALTNSIFFDSQIANNLVHDYLISMSTDSNYETLFESANDLFRYGNYYRGERDGAFSWGINGIPFLYFGPGTYYSGAFTFVHELGHYYNNIAGYRTSNDTAEIHSQGNEMMFLAYLETCLPEEILNEMYARLYYTQLTDILNTVLIASCVDEFEYCVYTGTTPDGQSTTYTSEDYDDLFISIMELYGIADTTRTTYWRSVTIPHAGYYISYAMSALPSIEILSIAGTDGYETAKSVYFNTHFSFTADYASYLVEVGLTSVFDESLYISLYDCFVNNAKTFSY